MLVVRDVMLPSSKTLRIWITEVRYEILELYFFNVFNSNRTESMYLGFIATLPVACLLHDSIKYLMLKVAIEDFSLKKINRVNYNSRISSLFKKKFINL